MTLQEIAVCRGQQAEAVRDSGTQVIDIHKSVGFSKDLTNVCQHPRQPENLLCSPVVPKLWSTGPLLAFI